MSQIKIISKETVIGNNFLKATHDEEGNKVYTFPPGGMYKAMDEYSESIAISFAEYALR